MRIGGQHFSAELLGRLRESLAAGVNTTRSALARQVCDWLGWRNAAGRPCEMAARKALVELERRGAIALPPPRSLAPQQRAPAPVEPWPGLEFSGTLDALGPIELVAVEDAERALIWRRILTTYHPLGAGPLCGAQRRYLIHSPRGWLGGLAFSAAAWHLAPRDRWIGWDAATRRAQLARVVANSRFLLLPTVQVPNLGSHVLSRAVACLVRDWPQHYGQTPVLLETFVDETRYAGTVYQAANWLRLGPTQGRGRQDRYTRAEAGIKALYVLPLDPDYRAILRQAPVPTLRRRDPLGPGVSWAEQEFGTADFPDGRLRTRLRDLAEAFLAQPSAPISAALQGDAAKTKAAYRFFKNPQVNLPTLLHPHYEATLGRIAEHPVVLAVQDTTSLNYSTHKATLGLGPIHHTDAQGLKLHDTLALTPEGLPLGLIDIQVWIRDAQADRARARPIEAKESFRWLKSFQRTAEFQEACPETRVVSVADREADLYELFQLASREAQGPDLLVRVQRGTSRQVAIDEAVQPLWDWLPSQPVAGQFDLKIPSRGGRPARVAAVELRFAPIQLKPPKRLGGEALSLWAVHVVEPAPPKGAEALAWLLLTTVPTASFEEAFTRVQWYTRRWCIEVFHRTLKSGCRIEDRRLGDDGSLQACLAIDCVVAWRILYLTYLGRTTPEVPCSVFFEEAEWQALFCYTEGTPTPPAAPPPLGEAMRRVAKLGGFLGRKGDGDPGATVLWRGLDKLFVLTGAFMIFYPALPSGP